MADNMNENVSGMSPCPSAPACCADAGAQTGGVAAAFTNADAGVAIIGFGTAGYNAAVALRTSGYEGTIRMFSNITTLPYSPILTSYYAGGRKTYEQCFPWTEDDIAELHLDLVQGAPVDALDVDAHTITVGSTTYPYAKCVIATGSRPMCYGFPQTPDYEPIVLRTMEDAERLKAALENPATKRVLVSGASMVALKSLEAALDRGREVTLVGMNPHVLDFNALPEAAERFERGLRGYGVELKLGTTIKSVAKATGDNASRGRLEVGFANGDVDYFDEITVAHGMKSNLEFLSEGALEIDRALVVDEFMRTSNPDVYAAGDVAQGLELVSGEKRIVGIWKNAAIQGQVAGAAIAAEMAGREPLAKDAFKGAIATNTIAVKDTLFISGGTMEVTPNRHVTTRVTDDMTVMYVFEAVDGAPDRLVGFNLTCDHDEAGSVAYDTGAMLTLRIEQAARSALSL